MWVTFFVLVFFIVPITNILHELGHTIVSKMLHVENLIIQIGKGKEIFRMKICDIAIHVHLLFFIGAFSTNDSVLKISHWKKAVISIGGPFINILVAFLLVYFQLQGLFQLAILFNLWVGIVNLLPFKLGEKKSDGYQCLEMLFLALKK